MLQQAFSVVAMHSIGRKSEAASITCDCVVPVSSPDGEYFHLRDVARNRSKKAGPVADDAEPFAIIGAIEVSIIRRWFDLIPLADRNNPKIK